LVKGDWIDVASCTTFASTGIRQVGRLLA